MKRVFAFILILGLIGCSKAPSTFNNIEDKILVMGHGGMGISSLYPSNSAESILKSLAINADGTEIDVQMTKDGQLVAFHDSDLEHSTNLSGVIHDYTWNELAGGHYSVTPFLDYNIVRLDDLFSSIENLSSYTFTFDIKLYQSDDSPSYLSDFAASIDEFYDKFELHEFVYIESQSTAFLTEVYSLDTQIGCYIYPQSFETGLNIANELGLRGISISNDNISASQVAEAHGLGYYITIWGAKNNSENKEAIAKHPDMIQTDDLKDLIKRLK
jgi:glycerophosphoryl diester phosphodiesterase